ncbi:endonuclease/exonuclease/phosphatase family protein [bacterium]|nr:endonuclease/exonuclease/phosphatase family protein [bacterium]
MVKNPDVLRVVTYNIHKSRGLDGRIRPERIAKVLQKLNADIISLQEVWSYKEGPLRKDQARFFSEELKLTCCVGETRKYRGGIYGNIILTRFPVLLTKTYDLTVVQREERGSLRADLDIQPVGLVHVFNIHLGTGYFERKRQAQKLIDVTLLKNPDLKGTRLVMGDFNEWTLGLTTKFLQEQFRSVDAVTVHPVKTFPGLMPMLPLDHIYFDSAFKLERLTIYRSPLALIASDHLPVVADFEQNVASAKQESVSTAVSG